MNIIDKMTHFFIMTYLSVVMTILAALGIVLYAVMYPLYIITMLIGRLHL